MGLWLDVAEVAAKTVLGGCLVVAFALLAQTLSPKRYAGVFAAAPSVALASLAMTGAFDGATDARRSCVGMAAGAIGFIAYALLAPSAMQRLGTLRGSVLSLGGWTVVTLAILPLAALLPAAQAANGSVVGSVAGAAMRRGKVGSRRRPPLEIHSGKAEDASARDLLMRFAFGAGTSALAGVVSLIAGPTIGGVFLAFPSILLASLTLIADEEGRSKARDDARGAAFGAFGLLCFAAVGAVLFTEQAPVLVFVAASVAWMVAGIGSFLIAWRAGYGADERQQRG